MDILSDIYSRSLCENEKNIQFWEDYLKRLNALDFDVYSNKLKVPILVPIGNKILFRGHIKHTNEITVALGADYFTKCSIKQAEILRLHRIKDAQSKLNEYKKEKDYIESQISFSKENLSENHKDIIEVCSEEDDRAWRELHREKVRQYYQNKKNKQDRSQSGITDEELWHRLEELELQEEIENELDNTDKQDGDELDQSDENSYDSFIIKEDDVSNIPIEDNQENKAYITRNISKQTSKIDLLQQVIHRQKMLETQINEVKNRQRPQSKDENDLLQRLDEIEQMDELEDEMDRLDDIIESSEDENSQLDNNSVPKLKRSVSFADAYNCETLQISFQHSDVKPCEEKYDKEKGIKKPSDIYNAYSNLFANETTSILKKSKYDLDFNLMNNNYIEEEVQANMPIVENNGNRSFLKDVMEKTEENENKVKNYNRPTSLFKLRRQQQRK